MNALVNRLRRKKNAENDGVGVGGIGVEGGGGGEGGGRGTSRARAPASATVSVIVPLYIYPLDAESWKPLHLAIKNYPYVNFIVIINPHNGPGAGSFPDEQYSKEIPKLNAYSNVYLVGYVHVDYCRRDLGAVCEDVAKYAGWSSSSSSATAGMMTTTTTTTSAATSTGDLGMKGIFFDETPNLYSPKVKVYLDSVTRHVKGMKGIQGDRLVIHNPGTVPDPALTSPGPDITVIFEASYPVYKTEESQERIQALLKYERERCCFMVQCVPDDELEGLVAELRHKCGTMFITDLCEHVYVKFGPSWEKYVAAVAT